MRATSFGPFAARMSQLLARGELIPLHLGDSWLLPPVAGRSLDLERPGIHRYAPVPGLPPLRTKVAERLRERYGFETDADHVFITPGSTGGLAVAVEALFDPGDEVIVVTPSWPLIFGILQRRGVIVRELDVGPEGWPVDDHGAAFKAALRALITPRTAGLYYCDPNNPSGFVYPEALLSAIEEVSREARLWVLSDVAYIDLCFSPYRAAATRPGLRERVVTTGTFSKTYALAGHRVGWLDAPPPARELITRLITHTSYHCSTSAQELALRCLESPAEPSIFDSYRQGAAIVAAELDADFRPAEAGAFVFLDLRGSGVKDHDSCLRFMHRCLDVGVSLCPGQVFGERFGGFARLCYTSVPPEQLRRALRLLQPLLRRD
jgi:N-succinyldiaminopimelate aminotransferase